MLNTNEAGNYLTEEQKSKIRASLSHNPEMCETLCKMTLQELIEFSEIHEIKSLMDKQHLPEDEEINAARIVHDLFLDCGELYAIAMIYNYGKIQGIRSERAKRRGHING